MDLTVVSHRFKLMAKISLTLVETWLCVFSIILFLQMLQLWMKTLFTVTVHHSKTHKVIVFSEVTESMEIFILSRFPLMVVIKKTVVTLNFCIIQTLKCLE